MSIAALFPQIFAVCQTIFLIGFSPAKKRGSDSGDDEFFCTESCRKNDTHKFHGKHPVTCDCNFFEEMVAEVPPTHNNLS